MREFSSAVQTAINTENFKYFFLIELEFKYYKTPTTWSSSTDYITGDIVVFNEVKYIATSNNSNSTPSGSSSNWSTNINYTTDGYSTTNYYFTSYNRNITWNSNLYTADGGLFEFESPNFSSILDREAYKVVITDISDQFAAHFKSGVIGSPIKVRVGIVDPTTDQPLVNTADIISLYSGFVDGPTIENNWDTKLAVIEGTSPMADLDQINVRMVSKDGMDQLDASDTSFDSLYEDSEINLKWGKV